MTDTETIIEVRDLWFSFNGQPILKEVNLAVQAGEFLAVIGPNGGGKTTLLKLILGLLEPSRGAVRVFGLPPKKAVGRVGYVPQEIHLDKHFPISVLDVVLMGRLRHAPGPSRYSGDDRVAAREALERMDMWPLHERQLGELSGGQRQRVFVARALVSKPSLLLLDEPTAGVDPAHQSDFYAFLKDLNQTVTIVLVSHDIMIVSAYVHSVACVATQVFYHDSPEVTPQMIREGYQCPVDLVAHGLPHRVLAVHEED